MTDFLKNLILGIEHITDIEGYDHMLFLLTLCAPFFYKEWKQIFWLATAFTLGHSLTLALSAMEVVWVSADLIEKLIPVTIMLTALGNIFQKREPGSSLRAWQYIITASFGLIHGLGFSTYFKMMYDETSSRILSLLAFNLGVEAGQLFIVALIFGLLFIIVNMLKVSMRKWTIAISTGSFIVAAYLFIDKF